MRIGLRGGDGGGSGGVFPLDPFVALATFRQREVQLRLEAGHMIFCCRRGSGGVEGGVTVHGSSRAHLLGLRLGAVSALRRLLCCTFCSNKPRALTFPHRARLTHLLLRLLRARHRRVRLALTHPPGRHRCRLSLRRLRHHSHRALHLLSQRRAPCRQLVPLALQLALKALHRLLNRVVEHLGTTLRLALELLGPTHSLLLVATSRLREGGGSGGGGTGLGGLAFGRASPGVRRCCLSEGLCRRRLRATRTRSSRRRYGLRRCQLAGKVAALPLRCRNLVRPLRRARRVTLRRLPAQRRPCRLRRLRVSLRFF
mmetsp:Transcript_31549/g.79219  ORF Transcript_31549/g.79219 Transcript_31549/m.79219 type:complete len:313 (+) Transcript_31549:682-1620(+)